MQWQLGNVPDRSLTVLVKACCGLLSRPVVDHGHARRVRIACSLYLTLHIGHSSVSAIWSRETCFEPYAFCLNDVGNDRRSSIGDRVPLNDRGR